MKPAGHRVSISTRVSKFARHGDIRGLRDYIEGDAFMRSFASLLPKERHAIVVACIRAFEECERRDRSLRSCPALVRDKDGQVAWKAPGMIDQLRSAYAQGKTDEAAARLLGVSAKAFRAARLRHLEAYATPQLSQKAPNLALHGQTPVLAVR